MQSSEYTTLSSEKQGPPPQQLALGVMVAVALEAASLTSVSEQSGKAAHPPGDQ